MFVDYAKKIECDKLKTYIQISNNNVAVLQSPPDKVNGKTNKKEIISFLGYDWSNRKGDEGIKYVTDKKIEDLEDDDEKDAEVVMAINSIKYIKTPLYNPNDVNDNTKYSYAFRSHIEENCSKFSFGKVIQKKEEPFDGDINQLFSIKKLSDLIDFSNANFDKKINLNATENKIIKTKWPSNGSNIKSLNQTLLANVEISIPSMKKQEEILSELLAIENQIIEQRSIIEFGQEKKNRIIEDELI